MAGRLHSTTAHCCRRVVAAAAASAPGSVPPPAIIAARRLSQAATSVSSSFDSTSSASPSSSATSPSSPSRRRKLPPAPSSSRPRHFSAQTSTHDTASSETKLGATFHQPSAEQVTEHLNDILSGLEPSLPAELAMRMVTHKGSISPNAPAPKSKHNARMSFLGRRIIRLYLSIFYHAHANLLQQARLQSQQDRTTSPSPLSHLSLNDETLEALVDTYSLGRYVATRWQLEGNMQWRQMIGPDGRPTGLAKISGQAVEAVLGGVYRQYGAAAALQVFNSRILPFLQLPDPLRQPALQLAKMHGDLSASQSAFGSQTSETQEGSHQSPLPSTIIPVSAAQPSAAPQ